MFVCTAVGVSRHYSSYDISLKLVFIFLIIYLFMVYLTVLLVAQIIWHRIIG
jgi:hypothetical protein